MLRASRGTTLLTVLVVAALLMTCAFTAIILGTSQMQLMSRQRQVHLARDLAEAAVAAALGRLRASHDYGRDATDPASTIVKGFEGSDGQALLTFNPDRAAELGIPSSIYNFGNESAVSGASGSTLPGDCVQLIGVGRSGGVEHRIEVIVYLPRFPYVIASSGPIRSSGGLYVAGVTDASAFDQGLDHIPPSKLAPGSLVSNAAGGDAVALQGPENHITGDLQACGDATLSSGTEVNGEVKTHADPVAIPQVPLTDYDTANKPGVVTLSASAYSEGPLSVEGFARRQGDLEVTSGLQLHGGVLYVDGNLTVTGGISGKGAVIVTGTTTVQGGGNLATDNMAALLSHGSVSIQGTSSQPASFQGLLYTDGALQASHVRLAGTFIANSRDAAMTLDNARLYQLPTTGVSFPVGTAAPTPTPSTTPQIIGNAFDIQIGPTAGELARYSVALNPGAAQFIHQNPSTGAITFSTSDMFAVASLVKEGPPQQVFHSYAAFDADVRADIAQHNGGRIDRLVTPALISQIMATSIQSYMNSGGAPSGGTPSPTPAPSGSPGSSTDTWSIDTSQFLNVEDRERILIWRDL